ncbi:MAG TPA: hypothetical protein VFX03_03875 [Thermomicrobiales bacterium]|nr:hypothetical protein [Thermomicrobiales bacterium]
MNDRSFDRLTQRAGRGVSRRASLLAFGGAGLAGVFAGAETETARAKHKKNRCKKQTDQCIAVFTPGCNGKSACLELVQRCCPIIGKCEFNEFFDCVQVT